VRASVPIIASGLLLLAAGCDQSTARKILVKTIDMTRPTRGLDVAVGLWELLGDVAKGLRLRIL
jgi:hypothetical protein